MLQAESEHHMNEVARIIRLGEVSTDLFFLHMFMLFGSFDCIDAYNDHQLVCEQIMTWLRQVNRQHSNITELIEIGRSYENRSLTVIRVSSLYAVTRSHSLH